MKLENYCSIDYEFNTSNNATYNLVSVAMATSKGQVSFWLESDPKAKAQLKKWLLDRRDTHIFLAYNWDAEGRSFISLGLNPFKFKVIDIQACWKMLTNHNDKFSYGKQFIDGKFKKTQRLPYGDEKNPKVNYSKPPVNLLGCTYKLLGKGSTEDYEIKNNNRNLIIKNTSWTEQQKEEILAYGLTDVTELYDMYKVIMSELTKLYGSTRSKGQILKDMLLRGDTVARAAVIAAIGYPVDRESVVNFTNNIPSILKECQEDINSQLFHLPDGQVPLFKWNKKEERYSLNTKVIKYHIKASKYFTKWPRTPTGDVQISLPAFEKFFSWRHDFPRGNLFAQFFRYLRINQSLNGFRPKSVTAKNKNTFFSSYGSDDRAHPYLNAYGAQSSRYQPKATGFLHLKSAWMRGLVTPKQGRVICSIDYGSEEFLIAGLMAKDMNMLNAYKSGDVYLYFAKLAGAVPQDGTKAEYKESRDKFKSTCLARGTLVRVKGEGYLPIEEITKDHEVWDGEAWRKSKGAKYMGHKEVLTVEGISATRDHKIFTAKGWVDYGAAEKEKHKNGGFYFKDAQRLSRPSTGWREVWSLAGYIIRSKVKKWLPPNIS